MIVTFIDMSEERAGKIKGGEKGRRREVWEQWVLVEETKVSLFVVLHKYMLLCDHLNVCDHA